MNKRTSLSHLLAAILSGLLLAAAFPKWDQTYLLIFALVPLLWALMGQSLKAAFWLGLVSGLAHYAAMLYWIVYVTHVFGKLPLIAAMGIRAVTVAEAPGEENHLAVRGHVVPGRTFGGAEIR